MSSFALSTPSAAKRAFVGAVEDAFIMYSDVAADYHIGEHIGFGASSIVYYALYKPPGAVATPCALKVIDLDGLPQSALPLLRRETQLMALSKHPNVLRVRGSWMDGHKLYIALRLMRSGSVADVMRFGWPGGFEEEVIKCVLKQALEGLNYLHVNGFIHRDVKAANLLIDDDGTVLLGDLGVAVSLAEDDVPAVGSTVKRTIHFDASTASAQREPTDTVRPRLRHKRKSFVGTPCWMAPEVISQKHYDAQADMWSFGITALELAQGRPPYSREPSHRALMKILQDDSPTLDRDNSEQRYSRALKDIIDSCLNKDPSKRPTASQLLATPFFRSAKKASYLVDKILAGLPPLKDRQERRRMPSTSSHTSIASWDFTHSVYAHSTISKPNSPTTSIHHHPRQSSLSLPPDAVFEFEDDGPGVTDEDTGSRGFIVRERSSINDDSEHTVVHLKPVPGRRRGPGPALGQQHHSVFSGSPISESEPSADSVSEPSDDEVVPLPQAAAGAHPISVSRGRTRTRERAKDSGSDSPPSAPSVNSGSGGNGSVKLWRMLSGKNLPKDDAGATGSRGTRKSSFSARVSGMFASSSS